MLANKLQRKADAGEVRFLGVAAVESMEAKWEEMTVEEVKPLRKANGQGRRTSSPSTCACSLSTTPPSASSCSRASCVAASTMVADFWSCGVTLYVMLVGSYPFEDPRNFRKTISRILGMQYSIPEYVRVSSDCRRLLSQIFVADPSKRITIPEIKQHPWFLKNLLRDILEREKASFKEKEPVAPTQSVDQIMQIVQEAKTLGDMSNVDPALLAEMAELESEEDDAEDGDTY